MSLRDTLRSKTVGKPKTLKRKLVTVEIEGEPVEFEIRSPSLSDLDWINEQSAKRSENGVQMLTPALIAVLLKCVFPPGEDRHVFEATDRERLEAEPLGSWVTQLAKAANEFVRADAEALNAAKKS